MKKRYVYVVTIDWVNEQFTNGREQKVFSSDKKARDYMHAEYQKDLANYEKRFGDDVETETTNNTITLREYENYAENHIEYSLVKVEVE